MNHFLDQFYELSFELIVVYELFDYFSILVFFFFFFQAEDGIRDRTVTGVQTCALPILSFQSTTGGSSIFSVLGNVRPATDGTFSIPRVGPGEYKLVISGLRPGMYVKERSEERRVGKECRCGWGEES